LPVSFSVQIIYRIVSYRIVCDTNQYIDRVCGYLWHQMVHRNFTEMCWQLWLGPGPCWWAYSAPPGSLVGWGGDDISPFPTLFDAFW